MQGVSSTAAVRHYVVMMPFFDPQGTMRVIWVERGASLKRHALQGTTSLHLLSPVEYVELCRCQFEQGKAPIFNLVESGAGGWLVRGNRKCTFKASSVEECCEWAIALREAIASATNRYRRTTSSTGR